MQTIKTILATINNAITGTTRDVLTRKVTAFKSWSEMVAACKGGYVPTLYPTSPEAKVLARQLQAAGYEVYTGR